MRRAASSLALAVGLVLAPLPGAPAEAATGAPMVLTLVTRTAETTVALPLGGAVSGIRVNWGDGTITGPYDTAGPAQHTYPAPGTYRVRVFGGTVEHFGSSGAPSPAYSSDLLTSVDSFGTIGIIDLSSAFEGAINLTTVPTALPAGVTSLAHAFRGAARFNSPIGSWDTSHVTTMEGMFQGALAFDQPIGAWDTSSVADMSDMFAEIPGPGAGQDWTTAFNQPIGAWDTSSVTDFSGMFRGNRRFNQSLNAWDISSATTLESMFHDAVRFDQPLDAWDTSGAPSMATMFKGARSFDQSLLEWDLLSPGSMRGMFDGATSLSVKNLSDLLWSMAFVTSMARGYEGIDASSSYVYPAGVKDAIDAYAAAFPPTSFDIAGVAEPPSAVNPLVIAGEARVGGTLTASTYQLFTGKPRPSVAFQWQSSADGRSGWVPVEGGRSASLVLDDALGGRYLRATATASNGAGSSASAVSVNVLGPIAATDPTAPRSVRVTPGNRFLEVAWTPPSRTGGASITRYRAIARAASGQRTSCTVSSPAKGCTINDLSNGSRYAVSVRAVNAAARTGPPSAAVVGIPRTVPGRVGALRAGPAARGRVTLVWQAPARTGGLPVTGYLVRWRFRHTTAWTPWARVDIKRTAT